MNWKEEAKEKLRRYDAMQRSVVNIPREISRLQAESTAISSGLAVAPSGSRNIRRREDALLDNLVKRQQLKWLLEQAQSWTNTVERALSGLTQEEQLILQRMYILPGRGAVEQLMEKLCVEKSSIYRRHDKALQKFTLSLYGQEESN